MRSSVPGWSRAKRARTSSCSCCSTAVAVTPPPPLMNPSNEGKSKAGAGTRGADPRGGRAGGAACPGYVWATTPGRFRGDLPARAKTRTIRALRRIPLVRGSGGSTLPG